MADTAARIRFDHVFVTVRRGDSEVSILHDVTAEVPDGAIVAVIGPSGSGKSTLLSLCNLFCTPTRGQVFVGGREVRDWVPAQLRREVGFVFQTPVVVPGTVRDNLELGPRLHGERLVDAAASLREVGLTEDLLERPADTLSGGQRQRLALARALANRPSVLLLDEVTSALDAAAAHAVEALILRLRAERGLTVLWVTHDLDQAQRISDLTWLVVDGRIVEARETEAFFANPQTDEARRFLRGDSRGEGDG
jgi:putative ABC transport system ATP-binding protein